MAYNLPEPSNIDNVFKQTKHDSNPPSNMPLCIIKYLT